MTIRNLGFDRGMAVASVIVGITCLAESGRLWPLRSSLMAGDHALPGLTGIATIVLGLLLLFAPQRRPTAVVLPEKRLMACLMTVLGILAVYAASINVLGYAIPTGISGIPLFRMFGGYRWHICVIASILCTAGLYGLFVLGLGMSFPRGLFF